MIVPKGRRLAQRTVQYVGLPLLGLLAYDVAVVILYQKGFLQWAALEQIPLSLFGSAIGVILAFRNSTSYARWWEARTLWGSIVNNARSWARLVTTTLRNPGDGSSGEFERTQRQMVYYQIAWAHALRQALRRLDPLSEITSLLTPEEIAALRDQTNVPVAIQQWQSTLLRSALDRGWIDSVQWHAMNQSLDDLVDAQGGAERIKNTPMPRQYDYLPQVCAHMFCFLLPLVMVSSLGWFTPLGSTLVGFIFLALDKIGRNLEDPFDNTMHDIPLTSITRTIEINLRQMLGETNLPEPLVPVDDILW
ncbi:bestrophin family protein [Edaphobacter modestus]|uniref:Putative membrane protein n=1 Tax=Edaphobacter modestus TaxID=388466 RepID=A0A4Q7YV00_9BACT|nr:bestrophin family ion channel [Edaphobacter modestus]RZU40825.1 putative membrane protein [Edaphobacter modestus]